MGVGFRRGQDSYKECFSRELFEYAGFLAQLGRSFLVLGLPCVNLVEDVVRKPTFTES